MQQIERDCFSVAKRRSIYIYIYDVSISGLLGAPYIYIYIYIYTYIYDISSLRVNVLRKSGVTRAKVVFSSL